MTKKYSSNDEQMLLCEKFRRFVESDDSWQPDPYGRPGRNDRVWTGKLSPGERSRERNIGSDYSGPRAGNQEGKLTTDHSPPVLGAIHGFLQNHFQDAPSAGIDDDGKKYAPNSTEAFQKFFADKQELLDDLIAQTKVSYMSAGKGSLSVAMHRSDLYNNIRDINQSFRLGAPAIVRSVLKHTKRKTP